MNRFLKFAPIAFCACAVALVSCSDDDNNEPSLPDVPDVVKPVGPSADNVFTNGLPAMVDGAALTTNDKGQVIKIEDDYQTTAFEYGSFSRAESFDAKMTVTYKNYDDEKIVYYLRLNEQGFITYALEEYTDSYGTETETYEFKYDAEGRMTYVCSSDNDETFTLTYTDGNLTEVLEKETDGDYSTSTFIYTDSEVKAPYENKGKIMMFDEWNVDLDNIAVAYYAGLLGKAVKNLPLGYTKFGKEGGDEYTDTYVFHWEFNTAGFPTKFWEGDDPYGVITFTWK